MNDRTVIGLMVITIVGLLAVLVIRGGGRDDTEAFRQCVCSPREGRERECQDTVDVNNLYVTGKLTETTDLPSRDWTTISPGDMAFPPSNGCGWSNARPDEQRQWQEWDFTEFGN